MAEYVMKNGAQFEEIIKQKEDPRFFFLKSDHEFYPYYKWVFLCLVSKYWFKIFRMKLSKLRGEPEVKKAEEKKSIPVKVNKKQPSELTKLWTKFRLFSSICRSACQFFD